MYNISRLLTAVALAATLSACEGTPGSTTDPNPSASPSSSTVSGSVDIKLPDPTEIASFTGFKAVSCDQEANLKSSAGAASNIVVNNKTDATIKLYWLNTLGKRVEVIGATDRFVGLAERIDEQGALWVQDDEGSSKRVLSADVSVRGVMGYV